MSQRLCPPALPAHCLRARAGYKLIVSIHRAMTRSRVRVRTLRQDNKSVEDTLSNTAAQSQDRRKAGIQVIHCVERPPWPVALPIKLSAYLRRQELVKGAPREQEKALCGT